MWSSQMRNVLAGAQSVGRQAEVLQAGERAADGPVQGTQKVGPELRNLSVENVQLIATVLHDDRGSRTRKRDCPRVPINLPWVCWGGVLQGFLLFCWRSAPVLPPLRTSADPRRRPLPVPIKHYLLFWELEKKLWKLRNPRPVTRTRRVVKFSASSLKGAAWGLHEWSRCHGEWGHLSRSRRVSSVAAPSELSSLCPLGDGVLIICPSVSTTNPHLAPNTRTLKVSQTQTTDLLLQHGRNCVGAQRTGRPSQKRSLCPECVTGCVCVCVCALLGNRWKTNTCNPTCIFWVGLWHWPPGIPH